MRHWAITASYPHGLSSGLATVTRFRVPVSAAGPTVNDAVRSFERALGRGMPRLTARVAERVRLERILNLHDVDGMKDVPQIGGMIGWICAGGDLVHPTGLPNVKVVLVERGEALLFDGHHTVIAYMATGRKYLDQIPHLLVHGDNGHVEDAAILAFFGAHAEKLTTSNWRDYVIRWRAPVDRQLCKRLQKNMGELLSSLSEHGLWSDAALGVSARSVAPRRNRDADRARQEVPQPGPSRPTQPVSAVA
ncbi:MAG: hypothetical protein ACYTFI_17695 [Planctomycetota bacterium]